MSSPRLHHYFPQFHLRLFADGEGLVSTYDKRERIRPNPKALAPAAVAAEAHLYDDDHSEAPAAEVEEWLATEVDGPASAVINKIIARAPINASEREALARYVMSRDLRVPRTRDVILRNAQAHLDSGYKRWLEEPDTIRKAIIKDGGPDLTPEEIVDLGTHFRATVTKGFWLDFMQTHTVKAARRLLTKGWTLFHADDRCEFLTSDLGILKHRGDFDHPVPPAMGWSTRADGWLMPLTPKLILAMAPGLKPTEKLATSVYVDRFNATLAAQALEFVFARDPACLLKALERRSGAP
jgi:hypothetical protein